MYYTEWVVTYLIAAAAAAITTKFYVRVKWVVLEAVTWYHPGITGRTARIPNLSRQQRGSGDAKVAESFLNNTILKRQLLLQERRASELPSTFLVSCKQTNFFSMHGHLRDHVTLVGFGP